MGQYDYSAEGQITSLDGQVVGHVDEFGTLCLEDETLRANILQDLQNQAPNSPSFAWTENLLAAASLPPHEPSQKIRLACIDCDTDEADGIDELPSDWELLHEVQSVGESLQTVDDKPSTHSVFEWYTHLGICPCCRENKKEEFRNRSCQ